MDCPPVVPTALVNRAATLSGALWILFYALWEALVSFEPAVIWEQNQHLSKFISHSQDILLGVLLYTIPLPSALRQQI